MEIKSYGRRWRVENGFPRRRVGTRKRDASALRVGYHAGAWEPEKMEIKSYGRRWRVDTGFPRRRVGTRKRDASALRVGYHAGAWEPEKGMLVR